MLLIVAVIFGAAALAHTAPFPFLLEAFRPSRSLWHVKPQPGAPRTVYLTFDDGPNPDWTPPLLDVLRETGVRATFFLIDEHVTSETAPIVKRIADDGHAIGLHSGTRRLMVIPPEELARRLQHAAGRISAVTGREPCRLFRPHAGWRSATMYAGLDRAGYRLAGWSWGMWDWDWWQRPRADRVAARLARKTSAGDIIVIHDGHHANPRADRRHAAETVRLLAPLLRSRGFAFGALCEPGQQVGRKRGQPPFPPPPPGKGGSPLRVSGTIGSGIAQSAQMVRIKPDRRQLIDRRAQTRGGRRRGDPEAPWWRRGAWVAVPAPGLLNPPNIPADQDRPR